MNFIFEELLLNQIKLAFWKKGVRLSEDFLQKIPWNKLRTQSIFLTCKTSVTLIKVRNTVYILSQKL